MSKISLFQIECRADGKVGEIDIYGRIGASFFDEGVTVQSFKKDLRKLGDISRLNINIHSGGGSIMEGLGLFNAIQAHPAAEKHVYIEGLAGSMASILALTVPVENRHMAENAWYMIHNPSASGFMMAAQSKDLRKQADHMDRLTDQMVNIYTENSTLSEDEIRMYMDDETWFDAEEAKLYGFVGEVTDTVVDLAAEFVPLASQFSNAPEELRALLQQQDTQAYDYGQSMSIKLDNPTSHNEEASMNITAEMIRAEHPEIYAELVKDARAEAADGERVRIQSVLEQTFPGCEDLVNELAFDGKTTGPEAAVKVMNKIKSDNLMAFDKRQNEGNEPVGSAPNAGVEDEEDRIEEGDFQAMWDRNVEGCQDTFLSFESYQAYMTAGAGTGVNIKHNVRAEA